MTKRVTLKDDEMKAGKGTGDKAGVRLSLGALVGGAPGYLQWSPRAHERRQRNQACLAEVAHAWEAITQGQSTGTVAKSDVEYFFRSLHAEDEDGSPMAGFFDVMGVGAGIEAVRAVGATTGNVVKAVMSETKRRMSALALNAPSVPRAKPGQSQQHTKWPWDPAEQIRRFGGANGESLDREGFEALYMWSEFARPNVIDVFERYTKDKKHMTAPEYRDFLLNSQREILSMEEVEARIKAVRYIEEPGIPSGVLSSEGFAMLMTLDPTPHANFAMKNSAYVIGRQPAWRCPMDRPLSHYFISSSHNTYLSGNQFNGEVSSAGLLRALKLGVKVLELDCFDGRNEPMVKHGRTMTKQYPFRACVEAIGQYVDEQCAKGNIPFPTIITIENHCSPAHETLQAKILRETLGDKLAIPDPHMVEYPSPSDLQGKIIVRDKIRHTSPKEYVDLIFVQNKKSSAFKLKRKALQDIRLQDKVEATYARSNSDGDTKQLSSSWLEGECRLERTDSGKAVPSRSNLKRMHMVHARNVDKTHHDRPTSCSKSETKMQKLTQHQPFTLIVYARRNLLRVYPAGNRIMSTNYDPTPAWGSGCQIVALNYQAKDESVWLSNALFRDNGGCGYVLRPQWQLSGAERDVKALALTSKSRGARKCCSLWCGRSTTAQEYEAFETLRVRVRSAHRCERFFKSFASSTTALKVKFWDGFGGSEESFSGRKSTAPIVEYDMEPVEFQVSSRALSFIGFEVQVEGEGAVAQQCVVVGMLRPGLRAVPLAGLDSLPLGGAYLMVELEFPESLQFVVQDSPQNYKIIIPRSFDTPATEFVLQSQTEEDEMKRTPTMTLATDPADRLSAFTRSMVVAGLTSVLSLRQDGDINLAAFVRGMHSLGWTPEEARVTFAALVESPESDTLKAAEAAERVVRMFSGQLPTKTISDACDLSYLNDLVLS